ncbi:MAG: hypothetical protein M1836_003676 [Candelina mexicana]|nr:MAG: hypothetical protein M1836_003676 [Candelina mexicana]
MSTGVASGASVIATISFPFQMFAGCVNGFKLFTSANHIGKDAALLVHLLKLDEYRLILWAKKCGLLADDLDVRLNVEIINTALSDLKSLFEDTAKLRSRYGLDIKDVGSSQQQTKLQHDGIDPRTVSLFEHEAILQKEDEILARADMLKKSNHMMKKLWWAAVDMKGLESMVERVNSIITRLDNVLQDVEREDSLQQFKQLQLSLVNVTEKINGISLVQDVIKNSVVKDETLDTVAAMKALKINLADVTQGSRRDENAHTEGLSSGMLQQSTAPLQSSALEELKPLANNTVSATGTYDKRPVYVERKEYSASDVDGTKGAVLASRVQSLVLLLQLPNPGTFRSLRCIGSIRDVRKPAQLFIFECPTGHAPNSLLSYLPTSFIPSVEERWCLGETLATTLLHLHASGWLHKGLRSENVLFFPPTASSPRSLEEPYLMGYEYARRDEPGEISDKPSNEPAHAIYRHPNAQGPISDSFIKAYDIYALGLVLIEIAFWKPLAKIIEKTVSGKKISSSLLKTVRASLLDDTPTGFLQNVRFRMGSRFATVISVCIGGTFENVSMPAADFLQEYFERVLFIVKKAAPEP